MFPVIERITSEFAKELCQEITTDLPEYFGLSEANDRYFQGMLSRFSWGAKIGEKYVGLLTLEFPYKESATIYWMGVKRAFQGQGTGSALIESAVACAQWKGLNTLTVETLSPVELDENYIKTWRFYEKCGFQPLFDLKPEGYQHRMVYMYKSVKQKKACLIDDVVFPWEARALRQEDIPLIVASFSEVNWQKPASLYEKYLREQEKNQRSVWVAFKENVVLGYVTLTEQSDYVPFREKNIPEIMDFNILPQYIRQGIGSALLAMAEDAARCKHQQVGIGVGLYEDYGAAQQLYIKRGYIPDGRGVTYHYQHVQPDHEVKIDDDLVLWFVKAFSVEGAS